ncbi:MAG: tryptophan-rich sensory protein [Ruminococcus flavefaciens]|nr:tryptophan-rich sensory protein [Ruminococcus flavefaciens]MCM1059729.1 tryptophan-rich sensory protein [Eubacterium sp.]
MNNRKKISIIDLLIYIVSAELVGAVSSLITGSFTDFYSIYEKPPLLPPAWVFPIVWAILYAAMGTAAYLVSSSDNESGYKRKSLALYWIQLALNFSWSIIFFRFEAFWLAAVVILILLALIIVMMKYFYKVSPIAGKIIIPYAIWVALASYLNIASAIINGVI